MGGEKRCNLRKEEMIAANIADMMVIYLFTILLITLLSPVGIIDNFAQWIEKIGFRVCFYFYPIWSLYPANYKGTFLLMELRIIVFCNFSYHQRFHDWTAIHLSMLLQNEPVFHHSALIIFSKRCCDLFLAGACADHGAAYKCFFGNLPLWIFATNRSLIK